MPALVSVIIPVRNMAAYLGRALDSVWSQTYKPIEIIVADDGSTDGINEILNRHPLATVIRNHHPSPWGICGGRNVAFESARGEFVLPLDADDWIDRTYIEKTLTAMSFNTGIVSTHFMYHGENEGMVLSGAPQTYETELQCNNIPVCSLVRAEAIRQAGPWDHNLRGWEDWDMWLRILKNGWQHRVIPEVLFHYRNHNTGMNAWANQPENKKTLYGYLLSKHPGFGVIRQHGRMWNGV